MISRRARGRRTGFWVTTRVNSKTGNDTDMVLLAGRRAVVMRDK